MTTAATQCDGVLLIGFGGPSGPDEIRPFLDRVLEGRVVPRERYEQVVHHYEVMGGRSPYNELTMRQAQALQDSLISRNIDLPVVVGMRNAKPFIADALRELAERGVGRALAFILSPYRCEASYERYQQDIYAARALINHPASDIEYPQCWHDHPSFIAAVVDRIREAAIGHDRNWRSAELIFTAHSIPLAMASRAPYVEQLNQSAGLIADVLGVEHWTLAFQSRSGNPREPWLEPDIGTVLQKLAGRDVTVQPLGFLCDHVEVLYDLDVEAAKIAREVGVRMVRAGTVGDHPKFIEMITSIVAAHAAGG
jgi:protoporphyrin/coproporphyrin ferrochelatase